MTVMAVLLAALIANLTWLQVVDARSLQNNAYNTRNLAAEARKPRGSILSADGKILAASKATSSGVLQARPIRTARLAAHTLGYFSPRFGRAGIESAENDVLVGGQRAFSSWSDVIDAAAGRQVPGDDVVLTIDSRRCRAPHPKRSPAARARASCSTLAPAQCSRTRPLRPTTPTRMDADWDSLHSASANSPLVDRVSLGALPAGIDVQDRHAHRRARHRESRRRRRRFPVRRQLTIGNAPVTNFESGAYGDISLAEATMHSVNTVFAQLAVEDGRAHARASSPRRSASTRRCRTSCRCARRSCPTPSR